MNAPRTGLLEAPSKRRTRDTTAVAATPARNSRRVVNVLIWRVSFSKADCKSGNEYRGAFDAAFAEVGQRAVRVRQRVFRHRRVDPQPGGDREKLARILTRQVGDRTDHALHPQTMVRKSRD